MGLGFAALAAPVLAKFPMLEKPPRALHIAPASTAIQSQRTFRLSLASGEVYDFVLPKMPPSYSCPMDVHFSDDSEGPWVDVTMPDTSVVRVRPTLSHSRS